MVWRRELILAQLATTLAGTPGIAAFARSRGRLQSDKRPLIQLLDSDETAQRSMMGRGRPNGSPNYVWMTPGIYVTLADRAPENKDTGKDLNALCAAVIKRIYNDADLKLLLSGDDAIRYDGLTNDLDDDRELTGRARINMGFEYYFSPDEL